MARATALAVGSYASTPPGPDGVPLTRDGGSQPLGGLSPPVAAPMALAGDGAPENRGVCHLQARSQTHAPARAPYSHAGGITSGRGHGGIGRAVVGWRCGERPCLCDMGVPVLHPAMGCRAGSRAGRDVSALRVGRAGRFVRTADQQRRLERARCRPWPKLNGGPWRPYPARHLLTHLRPHVR
jgi:hypothetical protein